MLGVVAIALLAGAAAVVTGVGRGPQVDGARVLPGLQDTVRVLRDEHGIAYIFAANTPDLIRAQGFVTAQDRIFQMEGYRALATGRLAEVVGEAALASDRQIRLVGLVRNAARHARLLSPEARAVLAWYAEGINAYVTAHADDLPLELRLAGLTARPWTVDDMVTVLHFVNWSQAANLKAELVMQQLVDRFGAERALRDFAPVNINPDRQERPVLVGGAAGAAAPGLADRHLLADLGADGLLAPIAIGSNNWAIGRTRSASGAPVLVNDPHLDSRLLPGIWHPVGLFTPEIQAVGAALPAVPGLLVGRNAQVAFGVTNAYGDSQDLFVERLAPGRSDHYVDGDRVRPFGVIEEVIRVKDPAAPGGFREERMTVRTTVRGPVVSGPALGYDGEQLLSLRMASAEVPGGSIGIDRLLTARNVAEVDRAVQAIDVMYFNFVFADADGGIGHRATGRVPVRASAQGAFPKPVGAADDWTGTIPPERMPGTLSPARDWLATANNDTRPEGYGYDYSSYFAPSYRYRRIAEVLDQGRALTTGDQLALLLDTGNVQARRLRPLLVAALQADPAQADLARILADWDGRDDAAQAAPLIYHRLYERLAYETYVDEMGDALARSYLGQWYLWQERFDALLGTPDAPWFDDTRTPARETLPDLVRRAAATVRGELQAQQGADPSSWRWGDAHRVRFSSPLRRSGIGRDLLGLPEHGMGGSGDTVMRALAPFLGDGQVQFLASMRLVADLGDADRVQAVVAGGVVDRQFHPNQKDQLRAWADGRLLDWWFSPRQIEAHARHRQELLPR